MNKSNRPIIISIFLILTCILVSTITAENKKIIFLEDFKNRGRWIFKKGNWKVNNNSIIQYNTNCWNTNSYIELDQSGIMYYEWDVIMRKGILDAGLHIFASHGSLSERGSSYLVWQFKKGFVIYKSHNNHLREKIRFKSKTESNRRYRCRARYNPFKGELSIWQALDKRSETETESSVYTLIGQWVDKKPLRRGRFISFRTNKTYAEFSHLRIYRVSR